MVLTMGHTGVAHITERKKDQPDCEQGCEEISLLWKQPEQILKMSLQMSVYLFLESS